ncbi:hypothetical protein IKE87_00320 [Candidatus Saccharibacteria bacterium]|nr:hypothetical protein [Candidatus Saccharibacteria bacterium]
MEKQRKNYNKWIYWVIGLVVVVVIIVAVGLIVKNVSEKKDTGEVETSKIEEKKETEAKEAEEVSQDTTVADKAIDEKKVPQYEGDDPNEAEELTGVITYVGVSDGKLMIRVNIDQFLDSGECGLGLRQSGMNVYNTSARVVSNASTATCEGFDVPLSQVGTGSTHIIITVKAGEKTGTIEGEVTI